MGGDRFVIAIAWLVLVLVAALVLGSVFGRD
jgi:hypothetical protein